MGQRKKKNQKVLSCKDYKAIACELNHVYRDIDVLALKKSDLRQMIKASIVFDEDEGKNLDTYTLDDIRFEWFFLKHGNGDYGISGRLRANF